MTQNTGTIENPMLWVYGEYTIYGDIFIVDSGRAKGRLICAGDLFEAKFDGKLTVQHFPLARGSNQYWSFVKGNRKLELTKLSPAKSDWMSTVPDDQLISMMTIPGTHDSCATVPYAFVPPNQTASLPAQLRQGIRFLDIRCCVDRGTMEIYHGGFYQYINLGQVFDQCSDFLSTHTSETILVSIKQENSSVSDKDFIALFNKYIVNRENIYSSSEIPKLSKVRGKIIIVSRVFGLKGIQWNSMTIEDHYDVNIYDKNKYAKDNIDRSSFEHHNSKNKIFLTFLSTTVVDASETNTKLYDWTNCAPDYVETDDCECPYYGILPTNFRPGELLTYSHDEFISLLIKFNRNKYHDISQIISLKNAKYGDFVYSRYTMPDDKRRRLVSGWSTLDRQGYWALILINTENNEYALYNTYSREYLYANITCSDYRREVRTWVPGNDLDEAHIWIVSRHKTSLTESGYAYAFRNKRYGSYLYSSNYNYDNERRNIYCWEKEDFDDDMLYDSKYIMTPSDYNMPIQE